jgi:hypothetical protein
MELKLCVTQPFLSGGIESSKKHSIATGPIKTQFVDITIVTCLYKSMPISALLVFPLLKSNTLLRDCVQQNDKYIELDLNIYTFYIELLIVYE